jgi:lysophospholipase L1-like esterase
MRTRNIATTTRSKTTAPRITSRRSLLAAALLAAVAAGASPARAKDVERGGRPTFSQVWGVAQQEASAISFGEPNWSLGGFSNHSVRQVARVTGAGSRLRIRLSNLFGAQPLALAGATIARTDTGAAVKAGSLRPLKFAGRPGAVVIPAGEELLSDPLAFPVEPLEKVTITLYFAEPTGPATHHSFSFARSYRATGDHRLDTDAAAFTESSVSWYFLAAIEVTGRRAAVPKGVVVAFGDSITEGAITTPDADNRYPDDLAERLVAAGRRLAVINTAIGGNRVLNDSSCFGQRALDRFQRDVLDRPGVRTVIVLEGVNDIGMSGGGPGFPGCTMPTPAITAQELIAGHRTLIQAARARGIRILGGTITPFEGSTYFNEATEKMRQEVNAWIRTGGEYDAVVDFEKALADPANPRKIRAEFDAGDALHPNDAGMAAMAAAVELELL